MKKYNTLFINIIIVAGLISLFVIFSYPSTTEASVIETRSVMFLSKTRVQLNGFLDSSDLKLPADYWFEWGQTGSMGNFTYPRTVRVANSRLISERINLPDSAATYYFRAVVQSEEGRKYGEKLAFKAPGERIDSTFVVNSALSATPSSVIITENGNTAINVSAEAPLLIRHTVANLSFPNGAESIVAGKADDVFELFISVENISDKPIYNLRVSDKLSIFLELVDASPNYKYNNSSQNEVFWEIAKLAPKQHLEFKINAKGKKFSENIVIENKVTAANKDFSTDFEKISILLNNSPLEFVFKPQNKKIPPGGISEYEIYYRNEAEVSLADADLQIFLPKELKFKESDRKFTEKDNVLSLKIGEIKPGQEDVMRFIAIVSEEARNGKTIIVFATAKYQKNLSLNKESLTVVAESVIDKDFINLTAAIAENKILPGIIAFIIIIALIGLLLILFYRHRLYRDKKEKEFLTLRDTIKELEQKLKILTENQEEQLEE